MMRLSLGIGALVLALGYTLSAPAPMRAMRTDFFPTKVGTKWQYGFPGSFGGFTHSISAIERTNRGAIVSIVTNGGDARVGPPLLMKKILVSERGLELLHDHDYTGEVVDPPLAILKLPHKPGEAWERKELPWVSLRYTARESEVIRVPAGSFKVVRIDREIIAPTLDPKEYALAPEYYWYAPGVGVVKCEYGDNRNVYWLTSFTTGNADMKNR
jgi:hypothetical protein